MPALSVLLVVHREQAFLEECIGSVLADRGADVDLLVIDDASPDHGPAILDRLARADERMRVVHLPERAGRAAARDLALEQASGEHVWFVDATDRLAPGALARVVEAAAAADVLLVGHALEDALGRAKAGPKLRDQPALPGAGAAAPDAWRVVLRRSLVAGSRFGAGLHGELTVTWPALLAADRLASVPEPVYIRRRPGNAERHGAPRDVLAHYEAVLSAARDKRLVLPAATQHLLGLSRAADAAFVREAGELLRRHGAEPSGRRARALVAGNPGALARGDDRVRALRARVRRRRVALGKQRRRVLAALQRKRIERYYASRRRRPLDPDLAVFAAYWERQFACNPRAIYEKARELVPGFRGVWVVRRDAVDALPNGVEYVVSGTREYYDVLARASYFVNNVNFANHLVKRPGTKHVMTHHGTPLKRMGLDLRDTPVAGRKMDFDALLRRARRWDFSVSSNPLSTLTWERVFPVRHETLEVGYPRNDALANATDDDVRRLRAELGIPASKTAVLYAPTHREYRQGYEPLLDVGAVAEGLGDEFVVLARIHYFYAADPHLQALHRAGRILDVAAHPSIEELCLAADALVTDYSSLMFDYAVLDRPIVIHAPDWEVYRAMRGTTFDLMRKRPGVVTRTEAEVIDALRSGAVDGENARHDRAAFRAAFCPWDDGHAAERVVRRVWLGESVAQIAPPAAKAVAR